MRKARGYIWFVRRYGLWRLVQYERARRAGAPFDYGRVLDRDERAILEEHGLSMWGKRIP